MSRIPISLRPAWRHVVALIALGLYFAAPWVAKWPPGVDFAQHTALAGYLQHLFLSGSTAVDTSTLCVQPFGPYHIYHWIAAILLTVLPVWAATCGVITIAAALWLWAIDGLTRVAGASRWWVIAAAPLFYGLTYAWGMGPNLLGFFTVPLSMALTLRLLNGGRKSDAIWLGGVLILSVLIHPWPLAMALYGCGLLAVFLLISRQATFRRALLTLAALAVPGLIAGAFYGLMAARKTTEYAVEIPTPNMFDKLLLFPRYAAGLFATGQLETILCLLIILGLAVATLAALNPATRTRRELGLLAVVGLLFVPYFVLPEAMLTMYNVFGRTAPFAILGLLLLDGNRQTRSARLGRSVAVAAAVALLGINLLYHNIFGQQVRGLAEILDATPDGASHLGVVYPARTDFTRLTAVNHMHAYLAAKTGGVFSYSFTHQKKMPIVDCDPLRQAKTAMLDGHPEAFHPTIHLPLADFVLVRWPYPPQTPNPFADYVRQGLMLEVSQSGPWRLYRANNQNSK